MNATANARRLDTPAAGAGTAEVSFYGCDTAQMTRENDMPSPCSGARLKASLAAAAVLLLGLSLAPAARAGDFSFSGAFARDDDFQLFKITIGAGATMTVRSYSYAGGVNAAGQTIARGGFDPILGLATADRGLVFIQQDDGPEGTVPPDPATGEAWDVSLRGRQFTFGPGTYTLILMQFDNFPKSFYLANRFQRSGNSTFTAAFPGPSCPSGQFKDASAKPAKREDDDEQARTAAAGTAQCRDGHWALDILNVVSAEQVASVPTLLSAVTVTAGATSSDSKNLVSANLPIPFCQSAGLNAIVVDEEGKMLPEPDCTKRVGSLVRPPSAADADPAEPAEPAIGLVEVNPLEKTP